MNHIILDLIGLAVVTDHKVFVVNVIIRSISHCNRIDTGRCVILYSFTSDSDLFLAPDKCIICAVGSCQGIGKNFRSFLYLRHNRHRLPIHGNDLSRRNNIVRLTRLTLNLSSRTRISIARRNGISASLRRGKQPCIGNLVSNVLTIPRNRIGDSHRRCINARRIASVKQRRRQRLALPIRHVLAAHHQLLLAGGDHVDGVALPL